MFVLLSLHGREGHTYVLTCFFPTYHSITNTFIAPIIVKDSRLVIENLEITDKLKGEKN
jgi:hypothetical protein